MRGTILLAGVLPFISAFLGGVLAFSLAVAPQATAQSSEAQEVRASAFTLVGPEGTVIASLRPTVGGNGGLTLYDAAGMRRMGMSGAGYMVAWDPDGTTTAFRAGRTLVVGASGPPFNGVELGPDGSISMLPLRP